MSGAMRGALRNLRYAKRSTITPSKPPPSIAQRNIRESMRMTFTVTVVAPPKTVMIPKPDEGPDHVDVAVGEVQELEDPVDHRVAERDQRVDAAVRDPGHELGDEEVPVHPQSLTYRKRGAAASAAAPLSTFELLDRLVLAVYDLEDVELGAGDVAVRGEGDRRPEQCGAQVDTLAKFFRSSARLILLSLHDFVTAAAYICAST